MCCTVAGVLACSMKMGNGRVNEKQKNETEDWEDDSVGKVFMNEDWGSGSKDPWKSQVDMLLCSAHI